MTKRRYTGDDCTVPGCPCAREHTLSSTEAALQVRCPVCKARRRNYCVTTSGARKRDGVHKRRVHRRFTEAGVREAIPRAKAEPAPPIVVIKTVVAPPEIVDEAPAAPPEDRTARLRDWTLFKKLITAADP